MPRSFTGISTWPEIGFGATVCRGRGPPEIRYSAHILPVKDSAVNPSTLWVSWTLATAVTVMSLPNIPLA
jgi:hypothetical protein